MSKYTVIYRRPEKIIDTDNMAEAIRAANDYIAQMQKSREQIGEPMTDKEIDELGLNTVIINNETKKEHLADTAVF